MNSQIKNFHIGARSYSARKVLIIAEIGMAHAGDLIRGIELVDAAVKAGADCVKFQHVYADEIIHPATGLVPLPGGLIPLYERFVQSQVSPAFLGRMKEAAESRGALFLCTPFGLRSARELLDLGVEALKIASPELNHLPLLKACAESGLPTILSSGVSLLRDIERAVAFFDRAKLALLHCVTAYPAPAEDYNLELLRFLSGIFGVPCGVSDHSLDPVLVPSLSALCGAAIIEKHICLSRSDDGLDDPIALPPAEFALMVEAVRRVGAVGEAEARAEIEERHGREKVLAVLGSGVKELAQSERLNYARTNRSLHARMPISAGEAFSESNVALLRTEKVLRPGLEPEHLEFAIKRNAARAVPDGEGITWDDIGGPSQP